MCKEFSCIKSFDEFRRRMFVSKQSNTKDVPETNQCMFNLNIYNNLIYYLVWHGWEKKKQQKT